jgi:hypothetical protein
MERVAGFMVQGMPSQGTSEGRGYSILFDVCLTYLSATDLVVEDTCIYKGATATGRGTVT